MCKLPVLVLIAAIASTLVDLRAATAQVSGGGGCYDCDDISIEDIGVSLEQSFASTDSDLLNRQAWAGTICDNHPCFNDFGVIDEGIARDFLFSFLAGRQRKEDQWFAWAGFGVSVLGLLIALVALAWTIINDRRSRAANDRSIRNETLIEVIREEMKT